MDWKEADEFINRFYGVPDYDSLPAAEQKELDDLLRKEWDVQSWQPRTPEEEQKKSRLILNIHVYKANKWGSL